MQNLVIIGQTVIKTYDCLKCVMNDDDTGVKIAGELIGTNGMGIELTIVVMTFVTLGYIVEKGNSGAFSVIK